MNPALKALVEQLEAAGLTAGAAALRRLDLTDPTEALIVSALGDYVGRYGLGAVSTLQALIADAIAGKPVDLDLTDVRVGSDLLAVLQSHEAAQRSAALDAFAKVSEILATFLAALAKAALAAI